MKEQLVLRRGTPVYIEWNDSASYAGWRLDTEGMQVGKVRSIGYVFGVNNEGIILATSLARAPGQPDVVALDPVIVPHSAVENLQVLDLAAGVKAPLQLEGTFVEETDA